MLFSKRFWERNGLVVLNNIFVPHSFWYYFNFRIQNAVKAARYWFDEREFLEQVLADSGILDCSFDDEAGLVYYIMCWVNRSFPSSLFYTRDRAESWNRPSETLRSFWARRDNRDYRNNRDYLSTDCDDYAILIYSLCRVAGVSASNLRLCFMKTVSEWHLNVMYFGGGVPYAVEGTYFPGVAESCFGKVPYMQLCYKMSYYYEIIWFLFNENGSWKNRLFCS